MITNLDELKSANIVEIIERYLTLKKQGTSYTACCPFHSEKSPSFVVNEAKGFYKCFGCGEGGDVIKFVQKIERVDFHTACERIAHMQNIALQFDKSQDTKTPSEVLERVNKFAKEWLKKQPKILEYLAARGLSSEDCDKFDIGYMPSKKELLAAGFNEKELIACGVFNVYDARQFRTSALRDKAGSLSRACAIGDPALSPRALQHNPTLLKKPAAATPCTASLVFSSQILEADRKTSAESRKSAQKPSDLTKEQKGFSLPMHHRITIAIRNSYHKIVAFVARTHSAYDFPQNAPKYINSKESTHYKKSQTLYLYSNAKSSITKERKSFVVEGYIDCMFLHKLGYTYAVATGGTAFNVQHLQILLKHDCEVVFCFDNDKSGMEANFRAILVCFKAGFYNAKIALLKTKDKSGKLCKDINEAVEAGGLEFKFMNAFEFYTKMLYKKHPPEQAFKELKAQILACKNYYEKQRFLEVACKITGVPEEYFISNLAVAHGQGEARKPRAYDRFIASILHDEECAYIASELDLSFLPQKLRESLRQYLATKEPQKELADFVKINTLSAGDFYKHFLDLNLAYTSAELAKSRAKKDLKLVVALSEKIESIKQDIRAQRSF